jgi:DNA-binding transcriptional LysR family regulator
LVPAPITNSSRGWLSCVSAGGRALSSIWDVYDDLAGDWLVRVLPGYQGSPGVQIKAGHRLSSLVPRRATAFIDFLTELYLPIPPWEIAPEGTTSSRLGTN